MAADFPYTLAPSRLPAIFERLASAGTPPKFTYEFLKSTLGFTSTNDRAAIPILRALGFIGAAADPTQRYNDFKGHTAGQAVADGLREGWSSLFMADQNIYKKPHAEVAKRIASITGTNETTAKRMASTFVELAKIPDWDAISNDSQSVGEDAPPAPQIPPAGFGGEGTPPVAMGSPNPGGVVRLHHDIHIHLPATSDAAVYRAVFQAIKSELSEML